MDEVEEEQRHHRRHKRMTHDSTRSTETIQYDPKMDLDASRRVVEQTKLQWQKTKKSMPMVPCPSTVTSSLRVESAVSGSMTVGWQRSVGQSIPVPSTRPVKPIVRSLVKMR
jgi:hypothetical protein